MQREEGKGEEEEGEEGGSVWPLLFPAMQVHEEEGWLVPELWSCPLS